MRQLLLPVALLLSACSTLSQDQRDQLATCQRNALLYFDGGRLDQAMGQVERGLALNPDDYKLNALRGAILLRTSPTASGTDHQQLDAATTILAKVYGERSAARHEPYLLTNYALALQKQGMRRESEALRLEGRATRAVGDEQQTLLTTAKELRQQRAAVLAQANELLGVLLERGNVPRLAHNHRAQIALQLQDEAAFLTESKAYFEQAAKDQAAVQREIDQTTIAAYEADQRRLLQSLRSEELELRGLLAEVRFRRHEWAEVVAQLNRVLEIDPARTEDYYNRGRAQLELGQLDAAKDDFRRFLVDPARPATDEKVLFAAQVLKR
ncbi:MAG: hypothetical protein JNN13_14080 [Planctomycetes bacterium]|nr:hypothetical protein [Planctomycetota bacterium]